jgi:hypothetical protein
MNQIKEVIIFIWFRLYIEWYSLVRECSLEAGCYSTPDSKGRQEVRQLVKQSQMEQWVNQLVSWPPMHEASTTPG